MKKYFVFIVLFTLFVLTWQGVSAQEQSLSVNYLGPVQSTGFTSPGWSDEPAGQTPIQPGNMNRGGNPSQITERNPTPDIIQNPSPSPMHSPQPVSDRPGQTQQITPVPMTRTPTPIQSDLQNIPVMAPINRETPVQTEPVFSIPETRTNTPVPVMTQILVIAQRGW